MNTIPTSATGIFDMYFNSTDSSTGHSGQDGFSFKYENGTWSDIGVHAPVAFTNTSTYVNQTSVADGEYIYLWASSTECRARFVSPYYEAPPTFNPPTGYTLTGPPSSGYYPGFTELIMTRLNRLVQNITTVLVDLRRRVLGILFLLG